MLPVRYHPHPHIYHSGSGGHGSWWVVGLIILVIAVIVAYAVIRKQRRNR